MDKFACRFQLGLRFPLRIQTILSTVFQQNKFYKILPFPCQKQHYFPESWPLTFDFFDFFIPFYVGSRSKSKSDWNRIRNAFTVPLRQKVKLLPVTKHCLKVFFVFCVIFTYFFYYEIFEAVMQTEIMQIPVPNYSCHFSQINLRFVQWLEQIYAYVAVLGDQDVSGTWYIQHVKHSILVVDEVYHLLGNNPTLLDEPFHTIEKARWILSS
jgi:hypothetical protein